MALMKYAYARVVNPGLHLTPEESLNRWGRIRVASRQAIKVSSSLIDQATDILEESFDPSKYLLSHATIVASVDTYKPAGAKIGKFVEDGFRVNRKYLDYRVKPETDRYINNNLDGWSRSVLLASYPTFIGGHNFCEHIQIPSESKGRIIDAVARDIGDSIYVDILIATNRKHKELIADIESGKMGTLSMGCSIEGSICTKCGHWAADESEMCADIKYSKGNVFYDGKGRRHRIAELCGHESLPGGGVNFIEASWVEVPAFTGAILQNIIKPTKALERKAQKVMSVAAPDWDADSRRKAAYSDNVLAQWGEDEDNVGDEGGGGEPAASPIQKLEDELTKHMLDRVKQRIREEMKSKKDFPSPSETTSTNETIVKEASQVYQASLNMLTHMSVSDVHLIDRVASLNRSLGIEVPRDVYLTSVRVGGAYRYASLQHYIGACRQVLGRDPTISEARTLVRLGKLISRRGAAASPLPLREENNPGHRQGE